MLSNLKSLTITANSIVGTLRVADKEVQTDFPVALLEHYVVNNRKRILKLLGFTNATANNPSNKVPFIYYVLYVSTKQGVRLGHWAGVTVHSYRDNFSNTKNKDSD